MFWDGNVTVRCCGRMHPKDLDMVVGLSMENCRHSESKPHDFDPNLQIHQSDTLPTYIVWFELQFVASSVKFT